MQVNKEIIMENGFKKIMEQLEEKVLSIVIDETISERKNAEALKIDRCTLNRKLRYYGIRCKPFGKEKVEP